VDLPAFHLATHMAGAGPDDGDVIGDVIVVADRDGVRAWTPDLGPAGLRSLCAGLRAARSRLLAVPHSDIITAIDAAARRLREAGALRRDVLRGLAAFTGYSPAMAEHVLDRMSGDWLAPALHRLVAAELGGADALDAFHARPDGSLARAVAPPLGLHVFAGNVPGVNVTSMVRALLVRSAVLGKVAVGEPVLAAAFARALHAADPRVADCVAVTYWPGGAEAREAAVLDCVDLVVHYGGAAALSSLRARAPGHVRFVEHGPRVSFAVVRHDGLADLAATARELARAVALFDQQGCVSPQLAYVVGSRAAARDFARLLAAALAEVADELPRGRLDAAEAGAVHEVRTRAEFRAIGGADTELWAGSALSYTVVYDADPAFTGSCLNRTLTVRPVADLALLIEQVRPFGRYLQTVGIAGFDDVAAATLAATFGELGASRITPIAAMPWPPVTWHHDGRGPLRELVRWVDLEH
jgi:hypothetical protein